MAQPVIAVCGATGKTGGAVAHALLAKGQKVRAFVRRVDPRSQELQRKGAEVLVVDLFDPDQLFEALSGVQRAYYLPLLQPYASQSAIAFATAAKAARVEVIVQMSQWLSHSRHPSIMTRETWLIDQLFASIAGVDHVVVNPGMFADNFLRLIDWASLLQLYPYMTADSASAPVSNEDIGRVVAEILINPAPYLGKTLRPTGPKLLNAHEIAGILQSVLGHTVRPFPVPSWLFLKVARMTGASEHEAYSYVQYMVDHRRGAFALDGGVNDVVLRVTGQPAESFAVTAGRYAALPWARRTPRNRLRALMRFLVAPMAPGFNPRAYERRFAFPQLARQEISMDSERWVFSHRTRPFDSAPSVTTGLQPERI